MSLDRRLRDEFVKEAARIEPQAARHLSTIEARARRHHSQVNVATLTLAAVAIAIVVLLRVGTSSENGPAAGGSPHPTIPSTAADSASYDAVAGTYTVTLPASDPAVQSAGVPGSWTMVLHPSGVLDLEPPSGFGLGATSPSGVSYSLAGDRFRTNLFFNEVCNSIGTYTWHLDAGSLLLVVVDDTCSERRTLLGTGPWARTP
jgi:hypothetical protein